jgi:hypothetical protein
MSNAYDSASLLVTPNGYKASKIYSAKPTDGTGDLAFSRASTAMRRNSAGLWESVANNVPRLQYPVGGGCPSWLFEPQATNLIINSDNYSQASWTKFDSTIASDATTSPMGILNADKIQEDATTSVHGTSFPTGLMNASNTYTFSSILKADERTWACVYLYDGAVSFLAFFNLSTGAKGSVTSGATSNIENYGNGWYRCSITLTFAGSSSANGGLITATSDGVISFAGVLNNGFFVWNSQLELGSVATSPIITAGSAVTRVQEASRTAGLSSIIGQTEGTLFVEFDSFKNVGSITQGILFAVTGANYIGIYKYGSDIVFEIVSGGAILLNRTIAYADGKAAITYNTNSFAAFFNGAKVGLTATIGVPPTVSSIDFGSFSGGTPAQGNVKPAEIYKTALSDSEAIELTTL